MKKSIFFVAILIILLGGVWYVYSAKTAMAPAPVVLAPIPEPEQPTESDAPMTAAVVYDGNTYAPGTVTIAKGGVVTFTSSGARMWVAADDHPTHTKYDDTSRAVHCAEGYTGAPAFDQCQGGTSYSFTFTKSGVFEYHDHINAAATGKVVVQ
jgi:plastocyanin